MKPRTLLTLICAVLGVVVSLYLLTVHWGWWQAVCLGVGDCEAVNTSRYSELLGIPVALCGALTYLAIITTAILDWKHFFADYALRIQFFLSMLGVAFSAYLAYVELFILQTICPWCVISAILITAIAVLSLLELREATAAEFATN